MTKPLVAIVGRPNVGKSTLFNRLIGRRLSIVEDTPGVTRDRIYADAEWLDYAFTLIDTGGIEPDSDDKIAVQMRRQAELAIETADVILFLVDGREGLTSADEEVASMLRKSKKPVVLGVNKIDAQKFEEGMYEFYELGLGTPITISASQGLGLGDLLDEVVRDFPKAEGEEEHRRINIAVAGKPNVGKSSLVNALLGEERSIVSDIPGTTRDSIDSFFSYGGRDYTLVDTAGIRRKRSIEDESIERYSVIRSLGAVRRADVVLFVCDAEQGLSEQDVRIAGYAHEEGKPSVVLVNKWDLIEKDTYTMDKFKKKLYADLSFMSYAPMLFVSALTGQRVGKIMDLANEVYDQSCRRITTGTLNDILNEAVMAVEPPSDKGRRLKLYYATQASIQPPTFIVFVNDSNLVHFSYERYLENYFRKSFGLEGTPVRLYFRSKKKEEG
ncbi:MAG: ribosome biogenesis GTPase Der [Clostridia bacterium]|nr:ribosome biogenesis GTPase Der [Clostridia bacterium]MBR0445278.1 ribosome biogenesis GTPase Der [Clostridia bacterium]